jgi:hypothetical protein
MEVKMSVVLAVMVGKRVWLGRSAGSIHLARTGRRCSRFSKQLAKNSNECESETRATSVTRVMPLPYLRVCFKGKIEINLVRGLKAPGTFP